MSFSTSINLFPRVIDMATGVQYELGTLAGGAWKQWTTAAGQDYYEHLVTRDTQYNIPSGYEDHASVRIYYTS